MFEDLYRFYRGRSLEAEQNRDIRVSFCDRCVMVGAKGVEGDIVVSFPQEDSREQTILADGKDQIRAWHVSPMFAEYISTLDELSIYSNDRGIVVFADGEEAVFSATKSREVWDVSSFENEMDASRGVLIVPDFYRFVNWATNHKPLRGWEDAVLFSGVDGEFQIIATDGKKFCDVRCGSTVFNGRAIINRRIFASMRGEYFVNVCDNTVNFLKLFDSGAYTYIAARLLMVDYPSVGVVLDPFHGLASEVVVSTRLLLDALDRIKRFKGEWDRLFFDFNGPKMRLAIRNPPLGHACVIEDKIVIHDNNEEREAVAKGRVASQIYFPYFYNLVKLLKSKNVYINMIKNIVKVWGSDEQTAGYIATMSSDVNIDEVISQIKKTTNSFK